MSLTPPSSRDASSIDGVTVTGTPSAGETIVADSATAAHWGAAGGGSPGIVNATIGETPLGNLGETPESEFSGQVFVTITTPPMVVGAMSTVASFGVTLADVPDISDNLDVTLTCFVTDQTGTNTGTVSGGGSTPTPVSSFVVDLTGTSATITGVDLSWDDGSAAFSSAAGGIYTACLIVTTGPD